MREFTKEFMQVLQKIHATAVTYIVCTIVCMSRNLIEKNAWDGENKEQSLLT